MLPFSFYIELTNLFYAIAVSDKDFSIDEKKSIVKLIKTFWTKNSQENTEQLMYEHFKKLIKHNKTATDTFNSFKLYYNKNEALFTTEIKTLILHNLHAISISKAGKNKAELITFYKTKLLFNLT